MINVLVWTWLVIASNVQEPAKPAAVQSDEPAKLLRTAADVYTVAKSYEGKWSFTLDSNGTVQKMNADMKMKGGSKLIFTLSPVADAKGVKNPDLPEVHVVLDGKNAFFEVTTQQIFYKVPLPKNFSASPLTFFPQVTFISRVKKADDAEIGGKSYTVLEAANDQSGKTRWFIDKESKHIKRIVLSTEVAFVKTTSTIEVESEKLETDIPDSAFTFTATKGSKEVPTPPEVLAIFTPVKAEKK